MKWFKQKKDLDLFQLRENSVNSYTSHQFKQKDSKTLEEGQSVEFEIVQGAKRTWLLTLQESNCQII